MEAVMEALPQARPAVRMPASAVGSPVSARKPVTAATYRRRRLAVLGGAFMAVAGVVAGLGALHSAGGGPLAPLAGGGAPSPATARVWVVRPGDTLWTIAESINPSGDPRPLVDRLSAEIGSSTLFPGERVPIP